MSNELLSCWDGGCDFWIDIVNEEDFTEKELEEVEELLYKWKKEEDGGEAVSDRSPLEEEEGLGGFSPGGRRGSGRLLPGGRRGSGRLLPGKNGT